MSECKCQCCQKREIGDLPVIALEGKNYVLFDDIEKLFRISRQWSNI